MLAVKPRPQLYLAKLFSPLDGIRKLALAVSGGSDSLAMMHLVHEWARGIETPPQIIVISVDHGLRPEAVGECALVAAASNGLGFAHVTLHWDAPKPETGVQAKARRARYDLMSNWCLANQVPVLLTAHTADDQAETVVMRQQRTSSAKSLAGIWPERDWNGVRIMRPLLLLRRQELRDFLSERGVPWIDDPSNVDLRYERVRIREQLAGDVGAADLASKSLLNSFLYQASASEWVQNHVQVGDTGLLECSLDRFAILTLDVKDEVLGILLRSCGLNQLPDLRKRQALLTWLEDGKSKRRTLGGAVFAKRGPHALVGREPGRISDALVTIPSTGEVIWDGRFLVKGPVGSQVSAAQHFSQIPRRRDIPAFIDAGLPVISSGNEVLAAPFHGIGAKDACEFIGLKHVMTSWNYKSHTLC